MDILLKNAENLIRDSRRIENGKDLLIRGNRIEKIGEDLRADPGCRTIDCTGRTVMPGLVNAHTHLYQILLKGIRDDLELKPWCEAILFPFANLVHRYHWKDGDISAGYLWSAAASMEMIKSGTTCCINMDLTLDSIFEAWQDTGFRGIGAVTAVNRWVPKELDRPLDERKEEITGFIEKWDRKGDGLLKVFIAPSTVFACTTDFLEWQLEIAEKYDLGIQTHVSETKWEVEQARTETGMTPLEYLDSIGFLRKPISAAHCIHLTESEMETALNKGVMPVYNPKSNMKLGSGIAPVTEMLASGINVALATDGAASNDQLNMLEEMRTGLLLQKVANEDPTVMGAGDIFRMATENGALCAGIDAGILDEGKLADIAILNLDTIHTRPVHSVLQNIVYCSQPENVETTIINGRIVMENRVIQGVDEADILKRIVAMYDEKFGEVDFYRPMNAEF